MTSTAPASRPAEMCVLVGGVCDVRCLFCHERSEHDDDFPARLRYKKLLGSPFLTADALRASLSSGAPKRLLFEGGEPTLHPELGALVRTAKECGVDSVGVITNGVRLSRKGLLRSLKDDGLGTVVFSIHGGTAAEHDAQTLSPGSFDALLASLREALSLGLRVMTHTVLNKENAAGVPELLRLLAGFPEVRPIGISTMYLNGTAKRNADRLLAPLPELARHVADGLRALEPEARSRVTVAGLPACLLRDFPENVIRYNDGSSLGPDGLVVGRVSGVQGPPCACCSETSRCDGVWKEYPDRFGWDGFRPLPGAPSRGGLSGRDARLASALERLPSDAIPIVPDSMAGEVPGAVPYSAARPELAGERASLLAYSAELHRLPAPMRAKLFSDWRPVYGNDACVVFERGGACRPIPASDPALRSLAGFVARLAALDRSGGVYRAASGLSFRCARGAADLGAVDEAWSVYFPKLGKLRPDANVLDLGAHIGAFALPAARLAPAGRIVAYEPDPESRALLVENVRANGITNVEARPEAAGRAGPRTLFRCESNPVLSNLYSAYGEGGTETVETLPLEAIMERHGLGRLDVLKVDVEGAEYEILFPAEKLLRERVASVIVEAHPREGLDARALDALLRSAGFEVERFGDVLFAVRRGA
jgi:FkbM family methyltransferase